MANQDRRAIPPRISRRPGRLVPKPVLGKKAVYFTRHALSRMKQRGISETDVFQALTKPDETGLATQDGRKRVRWFRGAGANVDVVYEDESNVIRVITVMRILASHSSEREYLADRRRRRLQQKRKRGKRR